MAVPLKTCVYPSITKSTEQFTKSVGISIRLALQLNTSDGINKNLVDRSHKHGYYAETYAALQVNGRKC